MSEKEGGEFVITDGVLVKYTGGGGDVVVPDGITAIGESAFEQNKSVTRLSVPGSVETIGQWAFYHCDGLAQVELADGVKTIDSHAFESCGFVRIVLPLSIKKIGSHALPRALTEIEYSGTVNRWNEIQKGVFWDYGLNYAVICGDGTINKES